MLILALIFVLTAAAMAVLAFREMRGFGSAAGETERRQPGRHCEDEKILAGRRKDDDVGGEN